MTETNTEQSVPSREPDVPMSFRVVNLIADRYGPYAFGIVSLLIIWYAVVRPQLEQAQLDFTRLEAVTEQHRLTVQSMNVTVRLLDDVSRRLERMEQRP